MSLFLDLFKGRTQKYIKRIPKAGGGYRYIYKEHHKGGVGAQEHMKEGAAFKLTFGGQEGHFHIVKAQGDKITVKHDELHGPDHKGVEMTKAELSALLTREHRPALEADAKKKRERVERMKRETPRHIGLKRAERLAKEAEARLGEERKPQRSAGYASDELGQSNYEKHGGLLDQAAERAGVPVSRNNVGRSVDGRIVRDSTPQVSIDSPAGVRKILKDITRAQVQFIQNRAIEWLAANSGDSPAEIREHIEHIAGTNQARAAQKYKDAAAALSEVASFTKDNRGRADKQQGTIKALEIIAEARKIGKQPTTPAPAPDQIKRDLEPKTSAELARVFESELKRVGFKGVKTWIKNEGTPREIARIYVQGEQRGRRGQGYIDLPMSADALPSGGALFADAFKHPMIDLRNLPRLTPPQVEALIQAQARLSLRLKGKSQIIADPTDNRLIKLMLDYTQRATATPQELTNLIKQTADMKQISRDSLNRNQTLEHISAGLSREFVSRPETPTPAPTPAPTPTPAPDNFETMPEGERIANKAREAIERVKAHINELRDQHSVSLSEDEALEIDERILDAQLTLRKLEREELKARRAAAKEQAPKAQPIEPPKPEPVKVAPAPAPKPIKVAPAPEPVYAHAQNTRRIVDRALSSKPTGVDLNDARAVLPNIGDLKLMLSEKERLKRAKTELAREFNRPNFLGHFNPDGDIDRALDHYLNGPYVEIEQKRLRDIEKGFKIALRDARGEDLKQVKEEIRRFWREWGGAYVRLHGELVTERTQGEALRKIRPLIQEGALTPQINQMLDRLEDIIDQKPVTSNDPARWIFFQETNKATRDNPRQTFREYLAETAPEATTPTQEEAPKTPREQLIETAREATAPAPEPAPAQEEAPEMVAFVEQALRDSIGKMRPARIIQRGEKITNPATYDNIETRYFFAVASAKLGRQFVDLGSRLDTPETRQAITDIYRATHTKGANAEQAKAQAYPLILEQIINTLEGFDLKTWFQTEPESLAKIERRIETLKQLKAKAQTPREATAPAPEPVQEQQPAPDNFETMPKDEFLEHPQVKGIIGGERGEVFRALNAAPREITVRLHQIVLDNYKEHKTTGFPEDTTVAILQAYKHPEEMAAKDKKLKERQAALAGLDERLPLAGIKASDLSLADAQASYRGVSWSGKERGEQELLEFKDILDRLEETGRQYIEAGAHEGDVSSVISYHAQKILDAKRAQIAARGRTMSAMITGRGNFPVRSQKKKMDTYDKRLSEFVAAVDKAKKQLKKLDPNSRHAQRIEQGSGVDAYQAKLDKLVALQAEYKKLRAKARKEGKEPELVIPQYLLTNNNAQIKRVREQIENEKQREQQLDTADKLKDYTMPDGNELQVDRDQKDNRLKLHFWEKPDKDTIAKLKRSGYKWSRYNEAWQRQLTTNALKELPSLLNNLGAVEAIEEADA